jgi:soluble lytic murein transglycosylase-like protein
MIKSTYKTIQDYFQPASPTSKRTAARASRDRSFGATLQRFYSEPRSAPASGSTGLSIRDYMEHRLAGVSSQAAALVKSGRQPSGNSMQPQGEGQVVDEASPHPPSPGIDSVGSEADNIQEAIQRAAARYDVPSDLIHSLIRCESNFKADAVSPAGAQGLMQLMPATARDLGVSDPFDIQQNIDGGTRYLRQMLDRFEGKVEIALAAYNAGPGTVSRYGGIPPYQETQTYVKKVMQFAGISETARVV